MEGVNERGLVSQEEVTSWGQSQHGRGVVREILTASGERKAVVKLPRARKRERKNTLCSVIHSIVRRDVISELHTREISVLYVTTVSLDPAQFHIIY